MASSQRLWWLEKVVDEAQRLLSVDAVGVGDAGTVAVGDERVDTQDRVRPPQQIRTTRVAETGAPFALGRVRGELQELLADAATTARDVRDADVAGQQLIGELLFAHLESVPHAL